jgi:catechol 2,3-dioxygenase-like lactoylglutathione lyase family enzyme
MPQHIGYIALLVRDYDEAISYFIEKLGFAVAEDTDLGGGKRWVLVAPHRESDWWPRLPILAH